MAPIEIPTPTSGDSDTSRSNKRRRLGERDAPNATQLAHQRQLEEAVDTKYYDPDQSIEERRAIRKGLRDLTKELHGRLSLNLTLAQQELTAFDRLTRRIHAAKFHRSSGYNH